MTSRSEIFLQNFFIFNSSYCQKEGEEHKNILYYYPPETDYDTRMKIVGLSEAIIKFADTFTIGQSCEAFHTQKSRQLYIQPEKGFWMVMTVNVPYITKTKDGSEYQEYQSDDVQDSVYGAVLHQAYQMFRLFKGPFCYILHSKSGDISYLKQKFDHFFSRGIQFLPLDKSTFLRVQCFVNLIEAMFLQVKYTAFLYNDQLVWSGLDAEDMQVVYRYLVTSLLPSHMETELQGGSMPRHPASPFSTSHYGKFVTGPTNLQDPSGNLGKVPRVYVNTTEVPENCHLVVYRSLSGTVCLFIDGSLQLTMELFKRFDIFLGPQLTSLVSEVAEQCNRQAAANTNNVSDVNPKFVYFNKQNLAQKSTVHLDNRRTGNVCVTPEVLRLLTDVNVDKNRIGMCGEIVMKTMSDYWVIGKFSNLRDFYVVIHQKNANLVEIHDEVKRLCENQLKNIFFHE